MNYAEFDTALDETYEIYSAYREKRGYPPSVREMAAMLNLEKVVEQSPFIEEYVPNALALEKFPH